MARIRVPQPLDKLLREVEPEKYVPLLGKYGVTDSQGRYLHWHEFKWRVKPGDDELAAWIATKFARVAIANQLSLQAEGDLYFSYCIPNSLFAQLYAIGRMAEGSTFVSSSEKNRYLVKSLMQEEAITSSQLEGAVTTREVAQEMLRKNLTPQDKSQQMILNNYLLMKKAIERKDEELSLEFILELHEIATRDAIENQAASGEFRKDNNIVVSDLYNQNFFYPPDWQTITDRLVQLCDFANRDRQLLDYTNFIHPIIKAIILHFAIAYIHPFGDGNGRTARAIFYWSILKSGYWLFEYVSISKSIQTKRSSYDNSFIYVETDNFDLTYFLYNQVETIFKAVNSLYEYIENTKREFYEFREWIDKSPVAKTLKTIQLEILKVALRKPGREFTAQQVSIDFGLSQNTARGYLNELVRKNLLLSSRSQRGKTIIYIAPASLEERLKLSST